MSNVLVITRNNWADEIDTQGFAVITEKAWKEHLELAKEAFATGREFTKGIGTNEDIEFYNYKDYKDQSKVKAITDEELAVLKKFFGIKVNKKMDYVDEFGLLTLLDNDYLQEAIDEGEEEEDYSNSYGRDL